MLKLKQTLTLLLLLVSSVLYAQVTTSGLSGKVTSIDGAVIGGHIKATHTPSGTVYLAVTNNAGLYTIQGMRPGGPYKVEVSYLGYDKKLIEGIQLSLGQTYNLPVVLSDSKTQLGEVIVVADKASNSRMGATQNFNLKAIENTPTISRDVYDIATLNPMVSRNKIGGISFVGANNRYNSFQIDGTVSNDVFGLSSNGTNAGQTGANPISIDAIQEIQVVVAPFDVRQSGFTGGAINAITKSGTNTFKGSAYTYYNNQDFYGRYNQQREKTEALTKQHTSNWGATLGGPIVKDKLFFFASVDQKSSSYPAIYTPGYLQGYITPEQAQTIATLYEQRTGIKESFASRNVDNQSLGLLGRIDWNINDKHKLAFRYQYNNSFDDKYGGGSNSYTFANSSYRMRNKTNSFVLELNSRLSNTLYNELRASLNIVRDNREVGYQAPTVQIQNVGETYKAGILDDPNKGRVTVNIGTDYSSGANWLKQNVYTIEDNLSWYQGNHTFTFGTHNEFYNIRNLFIQASNGSYYYTNLSSFLDDYADRFVYKYSDPALTGTYRWAAPIKAGQIGFYAQDKWDIQSNLQLTYGLRFDIPMLFNAPTTNPEFNATEYALNNNVRVGEKINAKLMVSPRLGFHWYATQDRKTLLRGGVGLFTGRAPFVWLSNAYVNTGMEMQGTTVRNKGGHFTPNLAEYGTDTEQAFLATQQKGELSKPDIAVVNKDFRFPQVLRFNLGFEQTLPYDVKFTFDGIYSKTLNNVFFENLALTGIKEYKELLPGVKASQVPVFERDPGSYASIINLKNTSKGYTYSLSAKLEKAFDFGLYASAAYTFGRAYSVNDGTSSVALSNWRYNMAINPNAPELAPSVFDVPHRVTIQLAYNSPRYANGLLATTVSLVYNGSSGQRYSLAIKEDDYNLINNDDNRSNTLLYIPTASELDHMSFDSPEGKNQFINWIAGNRYARTHRGQFAERYGAMAPWENHFDLHIAQDIYYGKGDRKVQIIFDVLNVANMINKNWGTYYSNAYQLYPVEYSQNKKKGETKPTFKYNDDTLDKSNISSRWHAQIGLRVTF